MEKRLKKQKARLIRRVTLILLGVWLAVSAAYCAVRTETEISRLEAVCNSSLADCCAQLRYDSELGFSPDSLMNVGIHLQTTENLDGSITLEGSAFGKDEQLLILSNDKQRTVTDTSGMLCVCYGKTTDNPDSSESVYGFLKQQRLRDAVSDAQLEKIADYLHTERDDGQYYEVVCSGFFESLYTGEIIPAELTVVLTSEDNSWYCFDEPVERFTLHPDTKVQTYVSVESDAADNPICKANKMVRNVVPEAFLFGDPAANDIIGTLTDEQLQNADLKRVYRVSPFRMVYIGAQSVEYKIHDIDPYVDLSVSEEPLDLIHYDNFAVFYARRINLLSRCGGELLGGIGVLLGFFSLIAAVLILMMWRMIREQAQQEQKRVSMTNALAHDIKTPLFVISGFAQNLRENINTEKREHYSDKIVEQAQSANDLVHRMLELSRVDSAEFRLDLTSFDFAVLAEQTLQNYTLLPESRELVFARSGDNTVRADRALMQCVLENLVDNAVKYSPPGTCIRVAAEDGTLRVTNACESLKKSDLGDIFEPYHRLDKNTRKNGSGLGLAIVKAILDKHGFEYKARLNNGSFVFTVSMSRRGD